MPVSVCVSNNNGSRFEGSGDAGGMQTEQTFDRVAMSEGPMMKPEQSLDRSHTTPPIRATKP